MWNQIRSFIIWLHQSDHVARFQRYFGVLPAFINKFDRKSELNANHLDSKNNNKSIHEKFLNSNGFYRRYHERKVTYDKNLFDECIEEIRHNTKQNEVKYKIDDYQITSWFWYYFFQFGSALGNEIFYILFFPTW